LSVVIAECAEVTQRAAARTERARADIEVSRAGIEAARKRQEEAIARQGVATAKLEELEARREAEGDWMRKAGERQEKMLQDQIRRTDEIVAESRARTEQIMGELKDQRDERRALLEALLRLADRLPPPPPHLRSA
jgi:hypothetical protein